MAYNNYQNSARGYQDNRGQRSSYSSYSIPAVIKSEPLPAEYIDAAENVIRELAEYNASDKRNKVITTSKLRNLLSMVSDIYNAENISTDDKLSAASKTALSMLRIRVAYEAGREKETKEFVEKAKLLQYIKGIGDSREKLIDFAHYMEALVAYHRYYLKG